MMSEGVLHIGRHKKKMQITNRLHTDATMLKRRTLQTQNFFTCTFCSLRIQRDVAQSALKLQNV